MRKIQIKTRLTIAFLFLTAFSFIIGLTGYNRLRSIGDAAVIVLTNVNITNDIFDLNAGINVGLNNMLNTPDDSLTVFIVENTRNESLRLLELLHYYIEVQDQFSDVFSPGEMQDMRNLLEIYEESYLPVLNEILELVEHEEDRRDAAQSIATYKFSAIYYTFSYYVNMAFEKNLHNSLDIVINNNANALDNARFMVYIAIFSLIISLVLAKSVTDSIARPLYQLEKAAESVTGGVLDVIFEHVDSKDEIARLSLRLDETMQQLGQVQKLKLEALEAQYQQERAEAATQSKSNFLAAMSHEIRTPMNAIIGMAELALREEMSPLAQEHCVTIKQAGANLIAIINDILDFSKIERGQLEILPENYQLSSLINDVIGIVKMRALDTRIRFTVNVHGEIPNKLYGDAVRIRQILLNLLNNAIKYTEQGVVSLFVKSETRGGKTWLLIEVSDTGKGIREEDMEKIFQQFVQVDMDSNKGIEGTGLGLAISKNLLNAMDGEITVTSEYGKGSTFHVRLPQLTLGGDVFAQVKQPDKHRVLIFDRRGSTVDSMARAFQNLGVTHRFVQSPEDFCYEIINKQWTYVFIASGLFDSVKRVWDDISYDERVVLLTEFGEAIADSKKKFRTLPTPVFSLPLSLILNGIPETTRNEINARRSATFTAPEARVMIVDDIPTNLNVAEGLMTPYKMQLVLCRSGRESINAAKDTVESGSNFFDIIFMDHMMPDIDGVEAVRQIRGMGGHYADVPIIALTANAVQGAKEMFIQNKFNDILTKPIDTVKLNHLLEKYLPKDKRKKTNTPNLNPTLFIEGLDTKKGIAQSDGNIDFYKKILNVFVRDGRKKAEEIKQNLADNDTEKYTQNMQILQNAAKNIGAINTSDLTEIEKLFDNIDL